MKQTKHIALLFLTGGMVMMCLFGGCKSQAERDLERAKEGARQAGEAADRATENYERLKDLLDDIGEP